MTLFRIGIMSLVLGGAWLAFSGHYDAFHLSLGALSVGLVMLSSLSLFPRASHDPTSGFNPEILLQLRWRNAITYPFILLLNIITANLKVAAIILDPHLDIQPILFSFRFPYQTDAAKLVLGNSITLTPGTITLDIDKDKFVIHTLHPSLADSLFSGEDQNRVARVFGDAETDSIAINVEGGP